MSMSIGPHPFLFSKKPKIVLLPEIRMELDPQTHIYLESVSPGELHEHIYMATPLSVLKTNKNDTLVRKKNGARGLKLWHSETNRLLEKHGVGPIWPHLFFFVCKAKNVKMVLLKTFDLITCSLLF